MRSFIKKDLLIFLRDWKELLTVLLLPIILVIVLNFAFAGLFDSGDEVSMDLQLAVVNQDNETEAMEQLKERLVRDAAFEEQEANAILEAAGEIQPVQLLSDYLESDDVKEWVTVHHLEEKAAAEKVKEGELDGMLVIPQGYTADSLYASFAGEPPTTSLIYKIEEETTDSSALQQFIQGFIEQLNYQFAMQEITGGAEIEADLPEGGLEDIGTAHDFTMTQYFTIALGGLFALFVVATVAMKTGVEIRDQVFNRILLANSHPMRFLIGKMVSTIFLVVLQIIFVLLVSHFLMDVFPGRSIAFWGGVFVMIVLLALVLSGLAAIYTAMLLRMNSVDAANGIFMFLTLLFGTLGGGFVPIYMLPEWLQQIGEWTPNGLFLSILTEWVQFENLSSIFQPSMFMIGYFLLFTFIGLALFPKRGRAQ
ncbi:ABC transporter permease [Terribacillus saccharophilus]|jgi:ABC-2 type transport system permease protein|uniref:Multidrug ABC transporter permease n=1 Tax=Terribacillus saccharophilus TaxID=361277 RepID=A0ABX4GUI6_9BACI|nr:ABC transporter permease [Terribacillus saccharophilus]PAD34050.1 multidrug ABC transporter permease [Terribacillus saccharophilus]PAD94705.1 multidrug ABC transporter permease [Terribacillus saccharophilus]PAD98523.1 multidrug ABC transporter permease [Terribacillus saccharophilus]